MTVIPVLFYFFWYIQPERLDNRYSNAHAFVTRRLIGQSQQIATVNPTICNSYTMGCPPVRGDNPRALTNE